MGIDRKLEDVCQRLVPLMMGQEGITGFLTNTENAGKISDLVDDIREAVMDYQVRAPNYRFLPRLTLVLDFVAARYIQQQLSTHRKSHPLASHPSNLRLTDR